MNEIRKKRAKSLAREKYRKEINTLLYKYGRINKCKVPFGRPSVVRIGVSRYKVRWHSLTFVMKYFKNTIVSRAIG